MRRRFDSDGAGRIERRVVHKRRGRQRSLKQFVDVLAQLVQFEFRKPVLQFFERLQFFECLQFFERLQFFDGLVQFSVVLEFRRRLGFEFPALVIRLGFFRRLRTEYAALSAAGGV